MLDVLSRILLLYFTHDLATDDLHPNFSKKGRYLIVDVAFPVWLVLSIEESRSYSFTVLVIHSFIPFMI